MLFTMLTLTLFRHAKSSWDDADLDDHERPLSKRGTADASRMAKWLGKKWTKNGGSPDLILCSDAVRTRATLAIALPDLGLGDPKISTEAALYLATPTHLVERLHAIGATARNVLLIGHNPGLHMLALELTGAGRKRHIAPLAMQFPTSAVAIFTFDAITFADVGPARGALRAFMTPKRLD